MPKRRNLLALFLAVPVWPLIIAAVRPQGRPTRLPLTPACDDEQDMTPTTSEGPYYRSDVPDRHDLTEAGLQGERITIAGSVVDADCRPIANAVVELWHADADGSYSGADERFRGAHRTDPQGRWWFSTIVPALYDGRTRHYHFKVTRPGDPVLTTQLFLPGEPRNARDGSYDPRLLMNIDRTGDGMVGRYDFVV